MAQSAHPGGTYEKQATSHLRTQDPDNRITGIKGIQDRIGKLMVHGSWLEENIKGKCGKFNKVFLYCWFCWKYRILYKWE